MRSNLKMLHHHGSRERSGRTNIQSVSALTADGASGLDQIEGTSRFDVPRGEEAAALSHESEPSVGEALYFGSFVLKASARLLIRDGKPVAIGGRALDLLIALTDRAGEVLSARELLSLVWPNMIVEEANLRVCVSALRKTLGEGQSGERFIINVAGRGYTFVAPVQRMLANNVVRPATFLRPPKSSNLPAPPQHMIGRDVTVDVLSSLLLSRRFVSIVGPGGIGKTTVAISLADRLRDRFHDGAVIFIDLGSHDDPDAVPVLVASALRCFGCGHNGLRSSLSGLGDKPILIVLDSCEHLIEAVAPLAEDLFRVAPSIHLIATSREALRVEGENVHLLCPLDCPPDDTPSAAQALAWPAVQLFMERALSGGYLESLNDSDAPIVANICRRLDGIPLAIELAASRVGTFGIRGTADLFDNCNELLLQGQRSALPRHKSLQAMLDWSFRLLSTYEQKVFCRLSTFAGPFSLEAAQTVASDLDGQTQAITNAIASLADKSLIRIESINRSTFFRFLDTTRAYAAAKLAESGEAEAVSRRHARYFKGRAQPCR